MIVQLKDITKRYGETTVLKEINMTIAKGEKIGIVGGNGAGKTTIFHMITGELSQDDGQVMVNKKMTMGVLAQISEMNPAHTVMEECRLAFQRALDAEQEMKGLERDMAKPQIYGDEKKLGRVIEAHEKALETYTAAGGFEMEGRILGVLRGLGFKESSWTQATGLLSGGEKTKLTLGKLLLSRPDLLLLDEPTNHLDFASLSWLEAFIRDYPGTVTVISHDRYFLDACVSVIYGVEGGRAVRYAGNYSRYITLRAATRAQYRKKYLEQKREIKKLETYVEKNISRASTAKMAKSRRKMLERIEKMDAPLGDRRTMRLKFVMGNKSHEGVLAVEDGRISVGDPASPVPLLENLNFQIQRGDHVAVIGENGIGKSTLLKTLIGKHDLAWGCFHWGQDTELGYYDQEHGVLNEDHTIFEELLHEKPGMSIQKVRTLLGQLLFPQDDAFKKISVLSGGEKSRVVLAKLVLNHGNVLLLDEPTNHLDLPSKMALEGALSQYEGTILFVSHDRYFINRLADRILVVRKNGVDMYEGNYDAYVEGLRMEDQV